MDQATTTPAQPTTPTPEPSAADATAPNIPEVSQTPPTPPSPPSNLPPHTAGENAAPLRTIILIVILALLAGILLFVALNPFKKAPVTATHLQPTPTVSPAHSILSMSSENTASSTGVLTTKTIDVNIDTTSNKVSGVQFEISYDPTVVANVKAQPGPFFSNPLTLLNQVDTKDGKIDFAVGIQPTAQQIAGSGVVATISYTVLPTSTTSFTKFSFLPKTQVIEQGILGSVLEKSIDLAVPIDGLNSQTKNSPLPTTTK